MINENLKLFTDIETEDGKIYVPDEEGHILAWLHVREFPHGMEGVSGVFDFKTRALVLVDQNTMNTSCFDLQEGEDPCIVFDLIGDRNREGWELVDIEWYSEQDLNSATAEQRA